MKSPEEVLRQVALDEIQFDGGNGLTTYTRDTFEQLIKVWRGRETGVSTAVFEPALKQLRRVYKMKGSMGAYTTWADHFFTFRSLVRYHSIYEINSAIKAHRDETALSIPSHR